MMMTATMLPLLLLLHLMSAVHLSKDDLAIGGETAPSFVDDGFDVAVDEGQELQFICNATGNPNPFFLWFRNGAVLQVLDSRITIERHVMKLKAVHSSDAGVYQCCAMNDIGTACTNFTLAVNNVSRPPTWAKNMEFHQELWETAGKTVELKCPAEGHPSPKIQWLKDDKPLLSRPVGTVKFANGKYSVRLPDVNSYDSGVYMCVVTNDYGLLNWTVKLDVIVRLHHPPIITDGPHNQTVYVGDTVRLTCDLLSDPEYHLQWLKQLDEHIVIDNETRNFVVLHTSSDSGSNDLVLTNVSLDDSGVYTCYAASTLGSTYKSAWLTVTLPRQLSEEHKRPVLTLPLLIAVVCIVTSGLAVMICTLITCRRCSRHKLPIRDRIVSMHANALYLQDSGALFDKDVKNSLMYTVNHRSTNAPLLAQLVPRICGQMSPSLAPLSEYEVQLDKKWEFPRACLKFGEVLGEGAFGIVMKAEAYGLDGCDENRVVAVKMLKEDATDTEMADLLKEMDIMKTIGQHTNLRGLLGCCTQSGPLYVIVEYAPHGNLRDFLREHRAVCDGWSDDVEHRRNLLLPALRYKDLVSFAFQVARGLEYMSSQMCIHRDVAARNVLVAENYVMKIADFGLTRNVHHDDYYKKTTDGRLPIKWMAPEALSVRRYTVKSDVWSYGVLLWEIFSMGGNPYPSVPVESLFQLLQDGHRMERPFLARPEVYQLMLNCWNHEPCLRPAFTVLVNQLDAMLTTVVSEQYLNLRAEGSGLAVHTSATDADSHVVPLSVIQP